MQNFCKIRIVKLSKGWQLSRDDKRWKLDLGDHFSCILREARILKYSAKRNMLKMTQFWSSNKKSIWNIYLMMELSAGLREEGVLAWVLLWLCCAWAESCPLLEVSGSLAVWLGQKSHRSELEGPCGGHVLSVVLINTPLCGWGKDWSSTEILETIRMEIRRIFQIKGLVSC